MNLISRKFLLSCLVCASLLFSSGIVFADENGEIHYLLETIAQSGCTFIRNDKEYSSVEARDHIAMKYQSVKWRIKTSEVFIRKLASRSSLSGKPYLIRCEAEEQSCEQWLFNALTSYRNQDKN